MNNNQSSSINSAGEGLPLASTSLAATPSTGGGSGSAFTRNAPCERKSDGIRREIHTFVLRQGHFTASERKAYEELHQEFCIPYTESLIDYAQIFGNSNPVVVEIGFGMGKATAIIA